MDKTVKHIYREAKKSLEENGANTLYLAMGFLAWWDPTDPEDADGGRPLRYAPLVLIPVDLTRKSQGTYQITMRDEDAQMNITLLEMLRQNFDLRIGGLNPLPLDEYGVDLRLVFNSMRKAIMEKPGWDIIEIACLGLFSFSQFVMWNDLRTRFDVLTKNKVVKALVDGLFTDYPDEEINVETLDDRMQVSDVVVPSSVDSSQLAAILEATRGSSFVLHGPPGTGKSQTITNMIANAIYQQKTVIFVAEKMAALDVVQKRLEAIGLGDYCLELHSNKTQKRVVLEKLANNLDLQEKQNTGDFEQKALEIQSVKNRLNATINALHKTHHHGYSIYDLIGIYTKQGLKSTSLSFTDQQLASLTPVVFSRWESHILNVGRAMHQLEIPYYENPLQDWRKGGYTLQKGREIRPLLSDCIQKITVFSDTISHLENTNTPGVYVFKSIEKLSYIQVIETLIHQRNLKTKLNEQSFEKLFDRDILALMTEIEATAQRYGEMREHLMKRYSTAIDHYDAVEGKRCFIEASGSFLFKGRNQRNALQDLNSRTRNGFFVTPENANLEFDAIEKDREARHALDQLIERVTQELEMTVSVGVDDWDAIADLKSLATLVNGLKTHTELTRTELYDLYVLAAADDEIGEFVFKARTSAEAMLSTLKVFEEMTGARTIAVLQKEAGAKKLLESFEKWQKHVDTWKNWSAFYESLEALAQDGLQNIVDGILTSKIENSEMLQKAYFTALSRDLIHYHLHESATLSRFNGLTFEGQIEEYNHLIDAYEKICQEQIVIKLSQNLPNMKNSTREEQKALADLMRVIRSKGRGTSIRNIFQESGLIIRRMTPVLLMSPLSVAQYIDPDLPPFDLCIFDEASQIRTSVAVGAMSRAKDCIIVGDPNQMPPTSFFTSQTVDEENLQLESLESLLEDCLAVNMPQRYLSWHYRSQSESLITFSNSMYYGGKMKTFPSPFERLSKVKYRKVQGVYERGTTRTNRGEADAIVLEIVRRLRDPELVKDSIGVVTFNIQQQNLIDDLFQEELRKDVALAQINDGLEEPIFIKNLENVQGDERDVIIFSICFGPDQEGKLSLNFGPLNRKGGWRRLNVAVSRARKEMILFTILEPHEITLRRLLRKALSVFDALWNMHKWGRCPQKFE